MIRRGTLASARAALIAAALLPTCLAPRAVARQSGSTGAGGGVSFLQPVDATRIADPKLDGGRVKIRYLIDPTVGRCEVTISAVSLATGATVATIWRGFEFGSTEPLTKTWFGRDAAGDWVAPGSYKVRVQARDGRAFVRVVEYDVDLVRLGIKSIAADSSVAGATNEWQTVYFMKNKKYAFYATPATGEYLSKAEKGEISDLDLDDGSPRPAPPVHTVTDEPLLELAAGGSGYIYENDWHNYPLCYLAGASPQFTLTFGANCTLADGTRGGCNYPVTGFEIRCVAGDDAGDWQTAATSIAPGGTQTLTGPALPALATRTERAVTWRFEYRAEGSSKWKRIPGSFATTHRIYTLLDRPYWATGASGTQYSGPWVEVLEYLHTFAGALGVTCDSPERVVEAFIKGYFGQNGSLTTAIEDVHYDCPSEGGDGGATHYFDWSRWVSQLSRLLNAHANGKFVNCTDCASSTSVMLSMLGVGGYKMDHLGSMSLRAIWGIGTDDYTLNLWGGGNHGFSYHHIITRDDGVTISDACLWVDEDGSPDNLPGTPGYNHDRNWDNYEALLAKGNVSWYTEKLPKIE